MSRRSIPNEDRISSLPDSIICHILSFLPTKSAATTSVLSKRWKPLWLSVPTLHFDDKTFPDYPSFFRFVSSIFLSRDIKLPLLSFHLKCSKASAHQSQDINRFVQAAVQRGIENLDLNFSGLIFFKVKLPLSIFNCRTLVVLRLEGLKVNDLSHVVVNFPLLKTLHLNFVKIESLEYLPKLLSGCPILEELQINYLPWATFVLEENFQCLPNLIRVNILKLSSKANALFTLFRRVKFLCVDLYTGFSHFPTFLNLIHMELTLQHEHCEEWKWAIEVLKRCPKLQNLTIHQDLFLDFGNGNEVMVDNWMDPTVVPECLSTQLKTCILKDYKSTECEVEFAKYIMQNAKVLNTMSIKSASAININVKYQMMSKLASSARASPTCELLFD